MTSREMVALGVLALGMGGSSPQLTADPLSSRVLLVSVNTADSADVANDYATARQIPVANRCSLTLPDPSQGTLTLAEYTTYVKTPVRTCLTAVGKDQILYIVLAYVRPYRIETPYGLRALDSYLADVWDQYAAAAGASGPPSATHRYYAEAQTEGQVYAPFLPMTTYRTQPKPQTIYSVWRLDASTPAIAKGLAAKAIQAETNGLTGNACFDLMRDVVTWEQLIYDAGTAAADWSLHRAAQMSALAGFSVIEDLQEAEFGAGACPNAALYSGWYSYNNYSDAFTWNTGAIGFHLDSASASDPRGGSNWSANALQHGISVTAGSVNEPYLEGLPNPGPLFRNLFEGANVGDAFLRNTRWLKWQLLYIGDPLYRPFASGRTYQAPSNGLISLSLQPRFVVGGQTVHAQANLGAPAPSGGVTITLTSQTPSVLNAPAQVTVPQNATSVGFDMVASTVTSNAVALISATDGTATVRNPAIVYPVLAAVTTAVSSIRGGLNTTGTVYLNIAAPFGGVQVSLSSDNAAVTVPSIVNVPAGLSKANFAVTTSAVSTSTNVTLTATYAGATTTTTLTVTP